MRILDVPDFGCRSLIFPSHWLFWGLLKKDLAIPSGLVCPGYIQLRFPGGQGPGGSCTGLLPASPFFGLFPSSKHPGPAPPPRAPPVSAGRVLPSGSSAAGADRSREDS